MEADLRRAICFDPYDDLPRLAYADLLDRHGEAALAELVRLQIRIGRSVPDDLSAPGSRHLKIVDPWLAWSLDFVDLLPDEARGTCDCPWCRDRMREILLLPVAYARYGREASWGWGAVFSGHRFTRPWGFFRGLPELLLGVNVWGFMEASGPIFSTWPISAISMSTQPARLEDDRWYWFLDSHQPAGWGMAGVLPEGLFHCLETFGDPAFRCYETAFLAVQDLGRAAIRYGRSSADLPEIPAIGNLWEPERR